MGSKGDIVERGMEEEEEGERKGGIVSDRQMRVGTL